VYYVYYVATIVFGNKTRFVSIDYCTAFLLQATVKQEAQLPQKVRATLEIFVHYYVGRVNNGKRNVTV